MQRIKKEKFDAIIEDVLFDYGNGDIPTDQVANYLWGIFQNSETIWFDIGEKIGLTAHQTRELSPEQLYFAILNSANE